MTVGITAPANLGLKAPDLEAELDFFDVLGATGRTITASSPVREGLALDGSGAQRGRTRLGSLLLVMFRRAPYDAELEALTGPLGGGIGHVAFDVPSTAAVLRAAAAHGVLPLLGPFTVEASANGPARRVTFFRSPNGTILETQEKVP